MTSCNEEADLDSARRMTYQPAFSNRNDFQNGTARRANAAVAFLEAVVRFVVRLWEPLYSARAEAASAGIRQFFCRGWIRAVDRWKANGPIEAVTDGGLVRGGSVSAKADWDGWGALSPMTGESRRDKRSPPKDPNQDCY